MQSPVKVLAVGNYACANVGDELLLATLRQWVESQGGELCAITLNPAYTEATQALESVSYYDLPAIAAKARDSEILVLGGGGIFTDRFPFTLPQLYEYPSFTLAQFASVCYLAKQFDLQLILWAQGVGPLWTSDARQIVADLFGVADQISVRDTESATLLMELGVQREIHVAPDPVWALQLAESPVDIRYRFPELDGKKTLVINPLVFEHADVLRQRLVPALKNNLNEDWACLWIGFQKMAFNHEDFRFAVPDDRPLIEAMIVEVGGPSRHVFWESPPIHELLPILRQADAAIMARFHGAILAFRAKIPVVIIEYDNKVTHAANLAGIPTIQRLRITDEVEIFSAAIQCLLQKENGNAPWRMPSQAIADIAKEAEVHKQIIAEAIIKARNRSRRNWQSNQLDWLLTWCSQINTRRWQAERELWKTSEAIKNRDMELKTVQRKNAQLHSDLSRSNEYLQCLSQRLTNPDTTSTKVAQDMFEILVIYRWASLGGVERMLLNRAQALKNYGCNVRLNLFFLEDIGGKSALRLFIALNKLDRYIRLLDNLDAVTPIPNLVISIDTPEAFTLIPSIIPLILECHTAYSENREYLTEKFVSKSQVRGIWVPSSTFAKYLSDQLPFLRGRIQVVSNCLIPLDSCGIEESSHCSNIPVLYLGRTDPLKNVGDVVRIVARARHLSGLDFNLMIVGDVYDSLIHDVIKHENLNDQTNIMPAVGFHETSDIIRQTLRRGGLFISASKGESFGLSAAEAMQHGLPVLLSDLPGHRTLVAGNDRLLFEQGDIQAAAEKLIWIAREGWDAVSSWSKMCTARFSPHNFLMDWYRALQATGLELDIQPAIKNGLMINNETLLDFWAKVENQIDKTRHALAERDATILERDAARAERDATILERDAARAERDIFNERINNLELQTHNLQNQNELLLQQIKALLTSKSWRWTKPLRNTYDVFIWFGWRIHDIKDAYNKGGIINIFKKTYDYINRIPKKFWKNQNKLIHNKILNNEKPESHYNQDLSDSSPNFFLGPRPASFPDYIVWGVIDWHFRHQRPQHLAQTLAASGRRVLYISSNLIDNKNAGFDLEPLDAVGRLFQVKLYADGAPVIYTNVPRVDVVTQLRCSIGKLLLWTNSRELVSLVQHPFWYDIAAFLPNSRIVYDCMDHHEGFGNTAPEILAFERSLLHDAHLTITTSAWLDELVSKQAKHRLLIRNGGEFKHFAQIPVSVYRDPQGRRIIGYYGAIAEWFDQDLVESIAKRFPDCSILLVGADTVNAKAKLGQLFNVKLVGEVPYTELPYYLHGFEVCILPFKVIPLTLATNPVKVYEYLSAGKPVVSVALPEMKQFGDLVKVADNPEVFLQEVADTLNHSINSVDIKKRQAFAKTQTWNHRVETLISFVERPTDEPTISIIVVTYNNLELTKACLESLIQYSTYPALEIIVVDNASSDGSREFLTGWKEAAPNRKLILNEVNKGFAAANNQGLTIASGHYLALLNNDTYVTPGWERTLANHLRRDKSIGLIGPVTNNIGNEAKINIDYMNMDEMIKASNSYTRQRIGQIKQLRTLAFFCVMMRRNIYEKVGPLDEAFSVGFFEDDDYCRRIEQLGLQIVCAEDVFVHHHLSASFNRLKYQDRQALFEKNKVIYETKWGKWIPHSYRK